MKWLKQTCPILKKTKTKTYSNFCFLVSSSGIVSRAWVMQGTCNAYFFPLNHCHRLSACVPHTFICWNLIPSVMVLAFGASGRGRGHKGGGLINRISTLLKEAPENSLIPSAMWRHRGVHSCEPESEPSPDVHLMMTWSWTSQPTMLWGITSAI